MASTQFDRALAANAFSVLDADVRNQVFGVYGNVSELTNMVAARLGHPPGGNSFNMLTNDIQRRRRDLRAQLAPAIQQVRTALGEVVE